MAGYDIGPRIGIGGEAKFNSQIKKINNSLREYGSEMKALTSEFEENENSLESLTKKNQLMEKQLEAQNQKLDLTQQQYDKQVKKLKELEAEYQRVSAELGENSKEAQKAAKEYSSQADTVTKLKTSMNETQNYINRLNNAMDKNGQMLQEIESGTRDAATGLNRMGDEASDAGKQLDQIESNTRISALSAIGDAAGQAAEKIQEIGDAAKDTAIAFGDSQGKLQANLGLTAEEAEKLNGVVEEVFESGFTDSVEEASDAVLLVKSNFKDLNNTDLSSVSQQLLALSKRTGTDLQENIIGATRLMQTYGLDAQQALDLIAQGYQKNLNLNGDFMDTLNEYSPLFDDAGYSASEMLNTLSVGMQNGARNSDLVTDAIKELQIKLGDGSFEESLGKFSDSTADVFKQWKDGQATVKDVANSVAEDLKKMSPAEQQEALSALSSQFEDLGIDASIAVLSVSDGLEDATGKAKEFAQATPGEEWQSSLNQIQTSMQEIGTVILEVLQPIIEKIADLADKFGNLPEPVQKVAGFVIVLVGALTALTPIITTITGIITALGASSAASAAGIAASGAAAGTSAIGFGALSTSLLPIALIIAGIIAAIIAVIAVIKNWDAITAWFKENFSGAIETVRNIISGFAEFFQTVWNGIKTVFETVWNAILSNPVVQIIVVTIQSLFEGLSTTLSGIWNGIKDIASGAWELIKNTILAPVLLLIDLVTGDFDQLRSDAENIWNNIKSAASTIWNGIKQVIMAPIQGLITFATSAFNGIKSVVLNISSSIQSAIQKIPGIIKSGFQSAIDFFTSLPSRALSWGRDFIQGFINGIKQKIKNLVSNIKGIGETIRSFLHFSRPDEGPLRDYETWMPDMISGLADGIYKNLGTIRNAAATLSDVIRSEISGNIQEMTRTASIPASQTIIIEGDTMMLDGKVIGKTAERRITAGQRSSGRAKGGRT